MLACLNNLIPLEGSCYSSNSSFAVGSYMMKDWFLESVWFTDSFNGLLKRSIDLFTFYGVLLNVFSLVNNLLFVAVSRTES